MYQSLIISAHIYVCKVFSYGQLAFYHDVHTINSLIITMILLQHVNSNYSIFKQAYWKFRKSIFMIPWRFHLRIGHVEQKKTYILHHVLQVNLSNAWCMVRRPSFFLIFFFKLVTMYNLVNPRVMHWIIKLKFYKQQQTFLKNKIKVDPSKIK